jgi:hypothetical protein
MALHSVSLDSNVGAHWSVTTRRYGNGDFGTPGRANMQSKDYRYYKAVHFHLPIMRQLQLWICGSGAVQICGFMFLGSKGATFPLSI